MENQSNKTSPKLPGSSLMTPEGGESPKKLSKFKPGLKRKPTITYQNQRDKNVPLSQAIMTFLSQFFHALISGLVMVVQYIMDNAPKTMNFMPKFDKKFIQESSMRLFGGILMIFMMGYECLMNFV